MVVDGNPALNRVRWAQSGREIAVGDSDGQVLVYDVGEVSTTVAAHFLILIIIVCVVGMIQPLCCFY